MKSNLQFLLIIAATTLVISGCASKIDATPIVVVEEFCDTCENDSNDITCAKEVKVVHYNDRCNGTCGFPVTVRRNSTCKFGGGM